MKTTTPKPPEFVAVTIYANIPMAKVIPPFSSQDYRDLFLKPMRNKSYFRPTLTSISAN